MINLSTALSYRGLKLFRDIDEAFAILKSIGFDAICPPEDGFLESERDVYIAQILKASKKHGIEINTLHSPIICEVPTKEFLSQHFFDITIEHIQMAKKMGCKHIVIHPFMPFKDEFFKADEKFDYKKVRHICEEVTFTYFNRIKPYIIDAGLICAIENLYTTDNYYREQISSCCSETDEWIKYIDTLGESFCACLDTGHANLTDRSDEKIIKKVYDLGSRLQVLHINDNYGKWFKIGDFHQLPFVGDIDLIGFAKALKGINYSFDFNFEVIISTRDRKLYIEQLKYLKAAADIIFKESNFE